MSAEINLEQIPKQKFFLEQFVAFTKKHDKQKPGLFKEELRCMEMLCLCSKTSCCYDNKSDKIEISSKGLKRRVPEESNNGPMANDTKILDKAINLTSTNRLFRNINQMVATYEQAKK